MKRILAQNGLNNFSYVIKGRNGLVICIDPVMEVELTEAIDEFGGKVDIIINTHSHADHTTGNHELVKKFNCPVYAHAKGLPSIFGNEKIAVKDGDEIDIDGENKLLILHTPGHTDDSISILHCEFDKEVALFCGDTLFNAGVGNCNSGDPSVLFSSIQKLKDTLSEDVVICPGHDYMDTNLKFCNSIDKENDLYEKLVGEAELVDFGLETKMNLFLRTDEPEVQAMLQTSDSEMAFLKLRELRNNW
ncbi:MAG: MBL fold metallo-hydrolase [Bacteriovoracaceae bacterium]|nr:MBL fold metallo-hydrolase [Bacteriovoracaceae bacterium]